MSVTCISGATSTSPSTTTGRLLDGSDREDRDLRRVEHGDELLDAEHAEVRDRERAALHVLQRQLAVAGAADEIGAGAGDLLHAAPVGVADDRHDEPVRSRDGHADVRPGMTMDLLAGEGRVDGAVADERDADEPGEQVVDGRLHVALGQARDELLAEVQRLRHVDRDAELEDRCRPRLGEPARDRLADRGQRDDLDLAGRRPGSAAGGRGAPPTGAFSTSSATMRPSGPVPASAARSIPRSRAIRRASGDALIRPPVGHAPSLRASPLLPGDSARGSEPLAAAAAGRLLGDGLGGARRACSAAAAADVGDVVAVLPDHGDRRADLDLAFGDDDLQQHAVEVRLDLLRDLVGVELVQRLALLDGVALGLQPADDRAGLHALPEPGQLDLGRHHASSPATRRSERLSFDLGHGRHYADAR